MQTPNKESVLERKRFLLFVAFVQHIVDDAQIAHHSHASIDTAALTLSVAKQTIPAVVCRHDNSIEMNSKSLDIFIGFCVFAAH